MEIDSIVTTDVPLPPAVWLREQLKENGGFCEGGWLVM